MDIFNDERRILSRVNNVRALVLVGRQFSNNIKMHATSFTGVKTIGLFYLRENTSCRIDVDFEVLSGRAKVVLIRKQSIRDIAVNTAREVRIFKLEKGFNRIRLVGENAEVLLTLVLTKGVTFLDQ
ncbi:MAG: hypothetical protein GX812_00515 [Erysipelotrichaceae bacterium]|jgi:hypothetical protein|nr:hypothetical protein [Erysipelotrichaceae bacterium]